MNTADTQDVIDALRKALGITEEYKAAELAAPAVDDPTKNLRGAMRCHHYA